MGTWFKGKSVIVTGAASGIGRAAAKRFAAEGGKVCAADLDGDGAERTVKAIKDKGGEAFACKVDISKEADNDRMVKETVSRFGGLDVAFLNAGFFGDMTDLFGCSAANFDKIISINLRGCFLGLKSVGAAIRSGGSIVVTASAAGLMGFTLGPAYSASKHGVVGLVRSSAEAFGKKGVRVNAICPGGVNTPMVIPGGVPDLDIAPDDFPPIPYRGSSNAEHIAEFALFLASNRAAFLTGGAYPIDGGLVSSFGIPADMPQEKPS